MMATVYTIDGSSKELEEINKNGPNHQSETYNSKVYDSDQEDPVLPTEGEVNKRKPENEKLRSATSILQLSLSLGLDQPGNFVSMRKRKLPRGR